MYCVAFKIWKGVVFFAPAAHAPISMAARVQRIFANVKQKMVGLAIASNKICSSIVCFNFVDVMHDGGFTKWFSNGCFYDQDVLQRVSLRSIIGADFNVALRCYSAATTPITMRSLAFHSFNISLQGLGVHAGN